MCEMQGAYSCAKALVLGEPTTRHIDYCIRRIDSLIEFGLTPVHTHTHTTGGSVMVIPSYSFVGAGGCVRRWFAARQGRGEPAAGTVSSLTQTRGLGRCVCCTVCVVMVVGVVWCGVFRSRREARDKAKGLMKMQKMEEAHKVSQSVNQCIRHTHVYTHRGRRCGFAVCVCVCVWVCCAVLRPGRDDHCRACP